MALNLWWLSHPDERYWMEITDRAVLGNDLTAPQVDGEGKDYWSYTLVTETRPGDIVLHWHTKLAGRPALVGWSEVTGPLSVGTISWQARGTSGRARGKPSDVQSWVMQCGGFHPFARPFTRDELQPFYRDLVALKDQLEQQAGGTVYFPFQLLKSGEVKASQGYLTKFPARLVKLFGLKVGAPGSVSVPAQRGGGGQEGAARVGVGFARIEDPLLRKTVERWAVEEAKRYYRMLGATRIDEVGKPYDLAVHGLGPVRHVEVKGSTTEASAVELTVNEVAHARNYAHTDLVVVDRIEWTRKGTGYEASGGRLRVWESWDPHDDNLSPTRFRYDLPRAVSP